ncbi:uncharacterized protein VP01_66g6 [Puccinia sorghi]|uniref:Uncharacterized protein n=1 Tax=Puccinia sorghi TaxID=27349 RepID=A0A0L6UEU5_9BASI|nr:uncharacterized protein VP01_66g6 [Puccinia sorghi]
MVGLHAQINLADSRSRAQLPGHGCYGPSLAFSQFRISDDPTPAMANKIAAKVARSFVKGHVTALEPPDPLYEISVNPQTGKRKRTQRNLPPGLSKDEEKILVCVLSRTPFHEVINFFLRVLSSISRFLFPMALGYQKKVRSRAHYLDKGFSICGFRFGWTFLIGFIPVVGDAADAALSYYLVIRPTLKCNLPALLIQRMLFNQILATTIGLVPIIGDIVMAIWKVNSRNAALFEDFITLRAKHAMDPSQPNGVTASETTALVENSARSAYIDGISGDREVPANQHDPVQSPNEKNSQPAVASENNEANKNCKPSQGWFKVKK